VNRVAHYRRHTRLAPIRNILERLSAATRPRGGAFTIKDLLTEPKPREVRHDLRWSTPPANATGRKPWYNFRWTPPDRTLPALCTKPSTIPAFPGRSLHDQGEPRHPEECADSDTSAFRRNRVGAKEADIVDSIPPSYTGGNIDNWADRQGRHRCISGCGRRRPVVGWRLATLRREIRARAVRQSNAR